MLRPQPHLAGSGAGGGTIMGATIGVSILYGAASSATRGASALGSGLDPVNQLIIALSMKVLLLNI